MQTYSISGYATETTLVAKQMEGLLVHVCCVQGLLQTHWVTCGNSDHQWIQTATEYLK